MQALNEAEEIAQFFDYQMDRFDPKDVENWIMLTAKKFYDVKLEYLDSKKLFYADYIYIFTDGSFIGFAYGKWDFSDEFKTIFNGGQINVATLQQ